MKLNLNQVIIFDVIHLYFLTDLNIEFKFHGIKKFRFLKKNNSFCCLTVEGIMHGKINIKNEPIEFEFINYPKIFNLTEKEIKFPIDLFI